VQVQLDDPAALLTLLESLAARVEAALLPGPGRGMHPGVRISTLDGTRSARIGDWVALIGPGAYRVIPAAEFAAEYEEIAR
jgi:hypothetical protein